LYIHVNILGGCDVYTGLHFKQRLHIRISAKFYYCLLKSSDFADGFELVCISIFEATRDKSIQNFRTLFIHDYVKVTAHKFVPCYRRFDPLCVPMSKAVLQYPLCLVGTTRCVFQYISVICRWSIISYCPSWHHQLHVSAEM